MYLPRKIVCFLFVLLFAKHVRAQYCNPSANCFPSFTIANVKFGTLDNSTSTCSISGYANYSSTVAPATVNGGKFNSFSATLTPGAVGYVGVWIDYNKNNTFEVSEYTFIGSGNGTTVTNNIYIPSLPVAGTTRMRVRRASGPIPVNTTSPCSTAFTDGEIEDYSVSITPPAIVIYYTPFADTLYDPVVNITARITQANVGLNTTAQFKPRLWYKNASSSTWKSSQGSLTSGTANDGNWAFPVYHDSLNFRRNSCDSVQYYFVAQDLNNPPNLSYLPEPATHTNVNTQTTPPATLFGYRLKPRLKDTVYVGSSDCRYTSLSGATGLFEQINARKLEGDLTILIQTDLQEDGIHDLKRLSLNDRKVIIRPATGSLKTIQAGPNCKSSVLLNGVKNILVDGSFNGTGKFLKFTNNNSPFADTVTNIKIVNSCDSIVLRNLVFQDISTHHTGGEFSILLSGGVNTNVTITNNLFTSLSTNQMADCFIGSNHGTNKALVRGNEFNNFMQAGILIASPSDDWIIDSNHFYRTLVVNNNGPIAADVAAIYVKGGGHQITKNYIGGSGPFCAGVMKCLEYYPDNFAGIKAGSPGGTSPCIISNNRIDNIDFSTASNNIYGDFNGILTVDNHSIITNNVIGNPSGSTQSIALCVDYIRGIASWGLRPVEIKNNIVAGIKNNVTISGTLTNLTGIHRGNNQNGNTVFTDSAIISGNSVYNLTNSRNVNNFPSDHGRTVGIYTSGGLYNRIEKNIVHSISVTTGVLSGIAFANGRGAIKSTLQKNRIYNLINTDNTGGGCCNGDMSNGIINGIVVTEEHTGLDILNNQVAINNNNVANPVSIRGIFEATNPNFPTGGPKQRVVYNSIYIGGTSTINGGSGCYVVLHQRAKEIYNNIFYNERTGGTTGHFGIRIFTQNSPPLLTGTRFNVNLYVVPDTSVFAASYPTAQMGWAQWKTHSGTDDSSYVERSTDVPSSTLFMNKAEGNLNINFDNVLSWVVNDKGLPYAGIADDYDNAGVRSTSPANGNSDIGADEFSTSTIPPGAICAGATKTFTSNLTGTTYQWQVKTPTGFTDISNSINYSGAQTVSLQISAVPYSWNGQQYRCVVNSTSFSNTFTLIVLQPVTPSVTVSTATTSVCSGVATTFTATPTNGGSAPAYQWQVNGANAGANSPVFSSSTLTNGAQVKVIMTSNATCVSSATATSNTITLVVTVSVTPSITISGATTVLTGQSTSLSAAILNGGGNPQYQWQDSTSTHPWQNIPGATNSTLAYTPTLTGNKVRCVLSSNANCAIPPAVTSNTLAFIVTTVTAVNPVPGSNYGIIYYPNPASSKLYIDSLRLNDKWQSLEVISLSGAQMILPVGLVNQTKKEISVERLLPGSYIIILRRKSRAPAYVKFIKL
jgi:hypothetical protein